MIQNQPALLALADALEIQGKGLLAQAQGLRDLASAPDETRLNLKQAASELGFTPGFVRAEIRRGNLKAERHGARSWRVPRYEVRRLLLLRSVGGR